MSDIIREMSSEFQLTRHSNGIRLVRPGQSNRKFSFNVNDQKHSVVDILNLPFCVYFIDSMGSQVLVNESTSLHCGFDSRSSATGKLIYNHLDSRSASYVRCKDTDVLRSKDIKMSELDVFRKDGVSFQTLSIKIPWYNDENDIIGLFGCASVIGEHSALSFLRTISEMGFIKFDSIFLNKNANASFDPEKSIYLTKREIEILKLTVRGKTANEVANILCLSSRTIEDYLANMKLKFHVNSKSELIDKVFDDFS